MACAQGMYLGTGNIWRLNSFRVANTGTGFNRRREFCSRAVEAHRVSHRNGDRTDRCYSDTSSAVLVAWHSMPRIVELMMSVATARAEDSVRKQELGHSVRLCPPTDPLSAKARTIALTVS